MPVKPLTSSLVFALSIIESRWLLSKIAFIKKNQEATIGRRQILVDVSVLVKNDAGTGIQRTVKGVLLELLNVENGGYEVFPVFATKKKKYQYVEELKFNGYNYTGRKKGLVHVSRGDIFLGLDLCAHIIDKRKAQLIAWKLKGVEIHFFLYDLLPVMYPAFFNEISVNYFRRWLDLITLLSDSLISISATTRDRYLNFFLERGVSYNLLPMVSVVPLGADIYLQEELSISNHYLSTSDIERYRATTTILMVGTIEPRKGYADIIKSFKLIWEWGYDINLIVIGRKGWKTEALQSDMYTLMDNNPRFKWYFDANDATVESLYKCSSGVIAASIDEGYGLPIIEATLHKKPVLARDIEIFREISCGNVTFFDAENKFSRASQILSWVQAIDTYKITDVAFKYYTWKDTVKKILDILS